MRCCPIQSKREKISKTREVVTEPSLISCSCAKQVHEIISLFLLPRQTSTPKILPSDKKIDNCHIFLLPYATTLPYLSTCTPQALKRSPTPYLCLTSLPLSVCARETGPLITNWATHIQTRSEMIIHMHRRINTDNNSPASCKTMVTKVRSYLDRTAFNTYHVFLLNAQCTHSILCTLFFSHI